jgi:hypothetical protein
MHASRVACIFLASVFVLSAFHAATGSVSVPDSHDQLLLDLLDWARKDRASAVGYAGDVASTIPGGHSATHAITQVVNSEHADGKVGWLDGTPFFYGEGAKWFSKNPRPVPFAFDLKKTGTHCKIYVDSTAAPYPSDPQLDNVMTQFDTVIYPKDTATFGDPGLAFTNIMIETMDGPYGVGGYYSGGDEIYVDCADISSWGLEIVAHEFQHLIHGYIKGGGVLWMNEGCSMYAIYVCYPASGTLDSYVSAHESDSNQDLTSFSNSMNDYGSCYVWVRYLADCYGGNTTIKSYVAGPNAGIQGIDDVLKPYGRTFHDVFPDWTLASYINDRSIGSGEYGYNGMSILMDAQGSHSFPWSGSGSVTRWASEYHIVTAGSAPVAKVMFTGGINEATGIIGAIGASGKPSTVYKMALDGSGKATAYVTGMGTDYSNLVLVASGLSGGGSYSWDVSQYIPGSNSPPTMPSSPGGPTSGNVSITYKYSTSATDPEGDLTRYTYDWGDGTTTDTIYMPSGSTGNATHSWGARGTYTLKVRAQDCRGGTSSWNSNVTVNIDNKPPQTPSVPSGPATGIIGDNYSYLAITSDPDGDKVNYTMDWDDNTTSDSALVDSGTGASLEHIWSATGTYHVRVRATDELNGISPWSGALDVKINPLNTPPDTPATPAGPSSGVTGTEYTYSTAATDPEANNVKCVFDWGDGTNTTTPPQASGSTFSAKHIWGIPGTYLVKALAIDEKNDSSGWSGGRSVAITASNSPPYTPSAPTGAQTGIVGVGYQYTVTPSDPDGNTVFCLFDWGDGTNTTTALQDSGIQVTASHSWAAAGTYQVRVRATDQKGANSSFSPSLAVIISVNNQATSYISGKVWDGSVSPPVLLADATVKLYQNSTVLRTVITGTDGYYLFDGLTAGEYDVKAEKSGFVGSAPAHISLAKDDGKTGTDFTLIKAQPGKGNVQVIVRDTLNKPLSEASVVCNLSGGNSLSDSTDYSGSVTFANVDPGTCTVFVSKTGYSCWKGSGISITGNSTATVTASLKKNSGGGSGNTNNTNGTGGNDLLSFIRSNTFIMVLLIVGLIVMVMLAAVLMTRRSGKKKDNEVTFYPNPQTRELRMHLARQQYGQGTGYPPGWQKAQQQSAMRSPQYQPFASPDSGQTPDSRHSGPQAYPPQYPPQTLQPAGQVPATTAAEASPAAGGSGEEAAGSGSSGTGSSNPPKVRFCSHCGLAMDDAGDTCARCGNPL